MREPISIPGKLLHPMHEFFLCKAAELLRVFHRGIRGNDTKDYKHPLIGDIQRTAIIMHI
jgi:hypothetical protein